MENRCVNIHTHRPRNDERSIRTAGIHPWQAEQFDGLPLPDLPAGCQAIGEIGLDYARPVDREKQERLLRRQLQRAEELGLPVVLHCVRAFEPLMRILAGYRLRAVIFHGFIGSGQQAGEAVKRGYCLSFGERSLKSPRTAEVLRTLPADRLFLETDESEISIEAIYRQAAELRGCTPEELRTGIWENYKRIFGNE